MWVLYLELDSHLIWQLENMRRMCACDQTCTFTHAHTNISAEPPGLYYELLNHELQQTAIFNLLCCFYYYFLWMYSQLIIHRTLGPEEQVHNLQRTYSTYENTKGMLLTSRISCLRWVKIIPVWNSYVWWLLYWYLKAQGQCTGNEIKLRELKGYT